VGGGGDDRGRDRVRVVTGRRHHGRGRAGALALAALAFACKDPPPAPPPPDQSELERPQRVFEPPPGEVRPVPPHAIRSDGVGPYLVGASLDEVLDLLPRGPRLELLEIEGVAEFNLVRAESDTILIGGTREDGVVFVAVLDPEIARTAQGVGVGSKRQELELALGPAWRERARAADPNLLEFAVLPGVRFALRAGRVFAVVVAGRVAQGQPPAEGCRDAGGLGDASAAILRMAQAATVVTYGCVTSGQAEAIAVGPGELAVVGGEAPDKLRRLATHRGAGLRWAAPLDVDGDGRDEIAVAYFDDADKQHTSRVEVLRWEGGRLGVLAANDAYVVSAKGASWTGADLADVEVLLEVAATDGELQLGGLYVHREKPRPREVALLKPRSVGLVAAEPRRGGWRPPRLAVPDDGRALERGDSGPARDAATAPRHDRGGN
jgi:hypothetical protein